jgi:hypothetical protein
LPAHPFVNICFYDWLVVQHIVWTFKWVPPRATIKTTCESFHPTLLNVVLLFFLKLQSFWKKTNIEIAGKVARKCKFLSLLNLVNFKIK